MSRNTKKWVDKKTAQTYAVVYRSHEDAKFHDEEAGEHVLVPVERKNKRTKPKKKAPGPVRENLGEAALYGIEFDDREYDYMQHLKPIGQGNGVFIAREDPKERVKDILIKEDIVADPEKKTKVGKDDYQKMQAVPDAIGGIQPDMDPNLREVLEALEDEEYVEDDEDVLNQLLQGGEREEDDEGDEWDMDDFDDGYNTEDFEKEGDQGWESGFRRFQAENKNRKNEWDSDDDFEDEDEDELPELPNIKLDGQKKRNRTKERKKKGAMTDTSSFSMSSSALFRSEGMAILDERFEKLQLNYDDEEEEEEEPAEFDMLRERGDFESLLDDFLENYELEKGGRKIVKKDPAKARLQRAADSVSRGKLAKKRLQKAN